MKEFTKTAFIALLVYFLISKVNTVTELWTKVPSIPV